MHCLQLTKSTIAAEPKKKKKKREKRSSKNVDAEIIWIQTVTEYMLFSTFHFLLFFFKIFMCITCLFIIIIIFIIIIFYYHIMFKLILKLLLVCEIFTLLFIYLLSVANLSKYSC